MKKKKGWIPWSSQRMTGGWGDDGGLGERNGFAAGKKQKRKKQRVSPGFAGEGFSPAYGAASLRRRKPRL